MSEHDDDTFTGGPDDSADGATFRALEVKMRAWIPGYELLDVIGYGGQGRVFKARDERDGTVVAIKILNHGPHASETARRRFQREGAATPGLDHPNIVKVLKRISTPDGHDGLVMNYIDGERFDTLWTNPRFAASTAAGARWVIEVFMKLCRVVQVAHDAGIVHRDLSPSNVLLGRNGEPYLLDFGLAWGVLVEMSAGGANEVSVTGDFSGKLAYSSPERATGERAVNAQSDVYSLGVMLYQLLSGGAMPYDTDSTDGKWPRVVRNILYEPPRPLGGVSSGGGHAMGSASNPAALERVVLKSLAKRVDRRYADAGALADDLGRYLRGERTAAEREVSALDVLGRVPRPSLLIVISLVAALSVGLSLYTLWTVRGRAPAAEDRAATRAAETVPSPAPAAAARTVDLLSMCDPARDAVEGSWEMLNGELKCTRPTAWARFGFPYRPPDEYDFLIEFTPESGGESIDLMLVGGGKHFLWKNDGWHDRSGFEMVGGRAHHDNRTTRFDMALENGRRYRCVVRVRRDHVAAYLDDKLISEASTDFSDFSIGSQYPMPDSRQLAVLAFERRATFHAAKITELSGAGELTR